MADFVPWPSGVGGQIELYWDDLTREAQLMIESFVDEHNWTCFPIAFIEIDAEEVEHGTDNAC